MIDSFESVMISSFNQFWNPFYLNTNSWRWTATFTNGELLFSSLHQIRNQKSLETTGADSSAVSSKEQDWILFYQAEIQSCNKIALNYCMSKSWWNC